MSGRPPEISPGTWRKSRHSGSGNACIEVAELDGTSLAVRDSKDPEGPRLLLDRATWNGFLSRIRDASGSVPTSSIERRL
ncbi:DUF397 domain-containing protein [Actinomadura sp. 21ATH]|uniref:DUF397 domain-containing protein n=1 Tax=Actinomadura sp. 21ATH TaxID=1735444 RepID=UPI0035C17945